MPEVGTIKDTKQTLTARHFKWNNSLKSWVYNTTSSSLKQLSYDRVYTATKRTKPRGFRAPTAYRRERQSYRFNPSAEIQTTVNGVNSGYAVGSNVLPMVWETPPATLPASVVTMLQYKAIRDFRDIKIELGVALVELPKTIRMITKTVTAIASSIRYAKKGNFLAAFDALGLDYRKKYGSARKTTAQKWLELQYGWTPLLKDVEGALKFYSGGFNQRRYGWITTMDYPYGGTMPPSYYGVRTGIRKLKLRLDFYFDDEKLSAFDQLGLANPSEIVWELLPFSFVADWFWDVGNWISATATKQNVVFLGGTFTDHYRLKDTMISYYSTVDGTVTRGYMGHIKHHSATLRQIIPSFVPSFKPMPTWDLSLKRMFSGIALVHQLATSSRR